MNTYRVQAYNTAHSSENKIHDDAVARRFGVFRRADARGRGVRLHDASAGGAPEFVFFGRNKDISRNSQRMIEVRRGDNATMEIAVVRRTIAIIREHESGDFVWESRRLGRNVSLSARMADNAGLEDFMVREFFPDFRSRY